MCFSVNGSVCLVCCVFVNFLVKQFAMWLLFCCSILWNCFVWVEVLCWTGHVWSSKECVCCACDSSVHLSVPSIGFVFICRKLSPRV